MPFDLKEYAANIDGAVQSHLNWTRRILSFAILRTPLSTDVTDCNAHTQCKFGNWFYKDYEFFMALDSTATIELEQQHRVMHSIIRELCLSIDDKNVCVQHLQSFEEYQIKVVELLTHFKNIAVSSNMHVDNLTQLATRNRLLFDFEALCSSKNISASDFGILLIEIDVIKQIYSKYGLATRNSVILEIADIVRKTVRKGDFSYRYSETQFLLLIDCPSYSILQFVAEKCRNLTEHSKFNKADKMNVTISIGGVCILENESLEDAISRADIALSEAKNQGRHICVLYE